MREPAADTEPVKRPPVLVVDDDEALARTLRRLLDGPFDVELASSGHAALEAIKRRSFSAILSDIEMPGMSGVELLRGVRAHDFDVPVILMTGTPTVTSAIDAVTLGALNYLVKPVANDVLVKAVQRATRLREIGRMKRQALKLMGESATQATDLAGLQLGFDRALESMWMAFQPIVRTDGRLFGYEALMRAKEPSLPHPGAILAAAERLGRVAEVGKRVRALSAEAFAQAAPDTVLFVNLHTIDLLDSTLYATTAPLARLADRVVLEITERSTIEHVGDVQVRVAELRRLGYRIAIDDLGAGYAGLSSFAALEPQIVKLDMSLVRNVHQSDIRKKLIESMAGVCKQMGMLVVAEGVESREERDCVRDMGCELLQGYLFAKPGPPFPVPAAID
jgi:EAL domain-containing protein (putative c-di-GMP-specific phosphodiesterase class I)